MSAAAMVNYLLWLSGLLNQDSQLYILIAWFLASTALFCHTCAKYGLMLNHSRPTIVHYSGGQVTLPARSAGLRPISPRSEQLHPAPDQEAMASRYVQQAGELTKRSCVCSRQEWEEQHLPKLFGAASAKELRASTSHCSICLAEISQSTEVRGLTCGHCFHVKCLAKWFMGDGTGRLSCPLCRVPLSQQRCMDSGRIHPP